MNKKPSPIGAICFDVKQHVAPMGLNDSLMYISINIAALTGLAKKSK
jgi:hypothetical protein